MPARQCPTCPDLVSPASRRLGVRARCARLRGVRAVERASEAKWRFFRVATRSPSLSPLAHHTHRRNRHQKNQNIFSVIFHSVSLGTFPAHTNALQYYRSRFHIFPLCVFSTVLPPRRQRHPRTSHVYNGSPVCLAIHGIKSCL